MSRFIAVAFILLTAWTTPPAVAEALTPEQRNEVVGLLRDTLKSDPTILREAIAALQEDNLRLQAEAARTAIARLGPELTQNPADYVAGNPKGSVTVVEFYDVRCAYCRSMLPTLDSMLKRNPDVRLVYKDLPVLGAASVIGARALLAAQKQGGYQKLHDALMAGSPAITEDTVKIAATHLGLDWDRMKHDMDDPAIKARIDGNLELSRKIDIQGTPAYVVGNQLLPGAVNLAQMEQAIAENRVKQP